MELSGEEILERLIELSVSTWRYDATPDAVHLGPMAQDFAAAFGLGSDDRVIHTVDAIGVLIISVQALCRRVHALEEELYASRP